MQEPDVVITHSCGLRIEAVGLEKLFALIGNGVTCTKCGEPAQVTVSPKPETMDFSQALEAMTHGAVVRRGRVGFRLKRVGYDFFVAWNHPNDWHKIPDGFFTSEAITAHNWQIVP